jgi:hypothetical protein
MDAQDTQINHKRREKLSYNKKKHLTTKHTKKKQKSVCFSGFNLVKSFFLRQLSFSHFYVFLASGRSMLIKKRDKDFELLWSSTTFC